MTTYEFVESVLFSKKEGNQSQTNEAAAAEIAQLVSGSFTYALCGALWSNGFDVETLIAHSESMYDNSNHFGLVYFIFILADAVDYTLPVQFVEMAANDLYVPFLSSAIIEDLLDFEFSEIPDSE